MEGGCWTVLSPVDSSNMVYSWYAAFFLFILLCLLIIMLCPFVWSIGFAVALSLQQDTHVPSRLSSCGFSLKESVGTSPGGTRWRQAERSLLSFGYRPTAEPEGTHHFPRRGACSGVHTLNAIGQWHHSPTAPGEVGLPPSQPPTEHFKLHQQVLDIPRAGWTRGPHARHLLLWWVSLKQGWSLSFQTSCTSVFCPQNLEYLAGFQYGAVHVRWFSILSLCHGLSLHLKCLCFFLSVVNSLNICLVHTMHQSPC